MHIMQTTNLTGPQTFSGYHAHGLHITHSGQHSHPSTLLPSQLHNHLTHHTIHPGDIVSQLHQAASMPSTKVSGTESCTAVYANPVSSFCGNLVASAGFTQTGNLEANQTATLLNSATILAVHASPAQPQPTQISVLTTAVPGLVNSQGESIFVPQATFSTPALLTNGDNSATVVRVSQHGSVVPSERHSQMRIEENCVGSSEQYRAISSASGQDMFPESHFHMNQEDAHSSAVCQSNCKTDNAPSSQSCGPRGLSEEQQSPICRDFLRNVCRRGKRCRYFHPTHGQLEQTLLQQRYGAGLAHIETLVCHDYQNQGCFRFNCRFLHISRSEEEHYRLTGELTLQAKQQLLESGVPFSSADGEPPICKNYLNGQCHRGSRCKFRHVLTTLCQQGFPSTHSVQSTFAPSALPINPSEQMNTSFSLHPSSMEAGILTSDSHSSATYSQLLPVSAAVFTGTSNHLYNSLVPQGQHIPLSANHVLASSVNGLASSSKSNLGAAGAATTATFIVPASMATLQPLGATSIDKANHHAVLTPAQVAIIPTVSVTGAVQDAPNIVTITNATHSLPCSAVHMNASGDLLTVVPALSLTATHQRNAHFHPHHQTTSAVVVSGISAAPASAYCAPPPGTTALLSVSTNPSCCPTTYPVYVATTSTGNRCGTYFDTSRSTRLKRSMCAIATLEDSSSRCSSSTAPMSPSHHTLCDSEDEVTRSTNKLSPQPLNASSASSTASSSTFSSTDPALLGLTLTSSLDKQISSSSYRPLEYSGSRKENCESEMISTSNSSALPHRSHRKKLRLQLFSESDSGTATPSPSWDNSIGPMENETTETKLTSSGISETIFSPSSSGQASLKGKVRELSTKVSIVNNRTARKIRLITHKGATGSALSTKEGKLSRSASRSSSLETVNNRCKAKPLSKSNSRRATVHHRHQVYMLRQMDELHRENRELRRALDDIRTANNDLRTANQVLLEQNVRLRNNTTHHLLSDPSAVPVTAVAMATPHFLQANGLSAASMCSILPAMTVLTTSNSHVANPTDLRHQHMQPQSLVQNTRSAAGVNTTSLHQHFSAAMASSTPVAIYSTSVHHNHVGTAGL